MEGEDINPVVLKEMQKNGSFLKLYSLFLAKISEEGQDTDILVLHPYKKVKFETEYLIAAEIVMKYLKDKDFTNTISSVLAESQHSEVYTKPDAKIEEKLKLPQTNSSTSTIQSLLSEWKPNISDIFYENRDRLYEQIQSRYDRLNIPDETPSKSKEKTSKAKDLPPPLPKNDELPPPPPLKAQKAKDPPPLKAKKQSKVKPPTQDTTQSYSYNSEDESIEPWAPPMGASNKQIAGKQFQLPKPKLGGFQFKPIQDIESTSEDD